MRRVQRREELATGTADIAEDTEIIEIIEEFRDGRVYVGEAVEPPMPQLSQKPALNDPDRRLDLRLVVAGCEDPPLFGGGCERRV
jgi:hypothetical protein